MTNAQQNDENDEFKLPDWVKPGASFRYNFKDPTSRNHGRLFHVRALVDGYMVVVREWSSRKGWMYTVEGPWFFNTHESHIVVGKPKKPAGLRKKSIDSAKEIQTDTAPALPHLSGPERWAFNIGPDDVVLRTKLYSLLGPVPARAMLAKAFPSGTAQPEIDEFFKLADSSDGSIVRKGAAIAKAINLAFARNDLEPPAAL